MRSGFAAKASGKTFRATSRFSRESRARYTSPIPPAPISATTSYGPIFVPRVSIRSFAAREPAQYNPGSPRHELSVGGRGAALDGRDENAPLICHARKENTPRTGTPAESPALSLEEFYVSLEGIP